MSDGGSRPKRSRRRTSIASNASADETISSCHPAERAVDANKIVFTRLKRLLREESAAFESLLDFVNLPDEKIDELFVSYRFRFRSRWRIE